MKNVRMKREELLAIIKENQAKHIAAFTESVEDFKKLVLSTAIANLELAKTNNLVEFEKIENNPNPPVSYESDYNRSIRMLELSVDDIIEIDEALFKQLVLDEWYWKNTFLLSNSTYKMGIR